MLFPFNLKSDQRKTERKHYFSYNYESCSILWKLNSL